MSEFKGTKGEWVWNKGNYHDWISTQDENEIICRMGQPYLNLTILDANALLISKAPEMLEMLDRLSGMCEKLKLTIVKIEIDQLIKEATEL